MPEKQQTQTIELKELNHHEEIIDENLKKVLTSLKIEKKLKEPIIVDKNTKVILDGHHRATACAILGLNKIKCKLVDYNSNNITVKARKDREINKEEIIEKGLSEDLFPPKTSKHEISE